MKINILKAFCKQGNTFSKNTEQYILYLQNDQLNKIL